MMRSVRSVVEIKNGANDGTLKTVEYGRRMPVDRA